MTAHYKIILLSHLQIQIHLGNQFSILVILGFKKSFCLIEQDFYFAHNLSKVAQRLQSKLFLKIIFLLRVLSFCF